MVIHSRYSVGKDWRIPVLSFSGPEFPISFYVPIKGFVIPTNGNEAVQTAIQALSRFFERYMGNTDLPNKGEWSKEAVDKKRTARALLMPFLLKDLSGTKVEAIPDLNIEVGVNK
jgi:hypothetical protein